MASSKRIPIPWKQRWQRFRYTVLPLLSFIGCVVLTLWMWSREVHVANAVGKIERRRFEATAGADGKLLSLNRPAWTLFEHVEANAVVAQLDPAPAKAALATARLEIARLEKEMDAAAARLAVTQGDRQSDHLQEQVRLLWQAQRYQLDVLDRQTRIATDRADLQRIDARIAYLEQVTAQGQRIVAPQNVEETKAQRAVIAAGMAQSEVALAAANEQLQKAASELAKFAPIESADVNAIVAPLQAAVAIQRSRVEELQVQIRGLVVRAPVSGTIAAVHCWPGQYVQAGDPIVTVAAERGEYIIGFLRQDQQVRPEVGMTVDVRSRVPGRPPLRTTITQVGPQFETAPVELLQDPRRPEWVLPIRIALPPLLDARPGEPVDLTFDLTSTKDPG
jgi:HlyD family secretion protein